MKAVTIDSSCTREPAGWHYWMVSMHDSTWQQLYCVCSLCSSRCRTDYETYRAFHDRRNRWWEEHVQRERRDERA